MSRDGRIAYKQVGPLTWEILESKVDSLLTADPAVELGPTESAR